MAGLFYDPELDSRKRALTAESEILRQTLKLELHNIGLYGAGLRRKLSIFSWVQPTLSVIGPVSALWLSVRRTRAERAPGLMGKLLLGWRLYRKYGHLIQNFFPGRPKSGWAHREAFTPRP